MPASIATIAPLSTLAFTWPGWLVGIIIALFLFVCVILVLAVLIQKPQGGGLASAFGGGASAGQTAFGTKTGDALTVVTISVFALYLLLAIILNYAAQPQVVSPEPQAEGTTAPAETPAAPADGAAAPADGAAAPAATPPADAAPAAPTGEQPAAPAPAETAPAAPAPTTPPTQPEPAQPK
ncbi:MAG: preprotein translocase subunit SecG [Planctomycetota bacterium]|jgi:protein translocase SecG subunit